MLGADNNAAANAAETGTSLLYAGEQYDSALSQYYLRARYYDPSNGRFNRTDPYAGNTQDPQSLHKYLYCHANPINATDPSGEWSLLTITFVVVLSIFIIQRILIPSIRAISRMIDRRLNMLRAQRFLAEVRNYMESHGWNNVGPSPGYDNALAHAAANIIAVRSGEFNSPQEALNAFQMREIGEGLDARMDRANNRVGNDIAIIEQENPGYNAIQLLKIAFFTTIENDNLLVGLYPKPDEIDRLFTLFERY